MRKTPLSKKEKRLQQLKKALIRFGLWVMGLCIAILLGISTVRYFGKETVIIDQSMSPTLQNEDVVLVNRLTYKLGSPKRMDVVSVKIGSSEYSPSYVRRVVGLPGETVKIAGGKLYIDDVEVDITFNDESIAAAGAAEEGIILEDDEYFVLCDDYNNNRDDSRLDSIGTIDSEQILGKVWYIWKPLARWGFIH